jgi:DNA-binding XRE family transcriptional regulator
MLDYEQLSMKFQQVMAANGHTSRQLAKEWGVSAMTIINIKNGSSLSAETLCRVCLYTGDNPLSYWREQGMGYDAESWKRPL